MALYRILIVDDEKSQREQLSGFLKKQGFNVTTAELGMEAISLCKDKSFEVALIDLKMPGMDGIELLKKLKESNPEIQVIMMTAYGSVDTAVDAMKLGAYHYVNKPINLEELKLNINKALEGYHILVENKYLKEQLEEKYKDIHIIGNSKAIKEVLSTVSRVAKTKSTVLVKGASGTGKELVARAIHALSDRADQRFVPVSCAALPETLFESELFGHERGAFTGAIKRREGRFELADGGTLFLDEVGDIPLETQVKLLRVIESQEFDRLGGKETLKVDVRIISATNQDLEKKIREKSFREDLYYRLNVISILISPLRERKEDILLLVDHFIKKANQKCGRYIRGITPEVKDIILNYDWPGNVRELENVIERGVVLSRTDVIDKGDLPYFGLVSDKSFEHVPPVSLSLKDVEKDHILRVLKEANWNLNKAAEILGIHRNTLRLKMREYGIEKVNG
ncbi:MAG: sigma-54-dependent Fis family transcriptional regulator [candidate division Zixibacteria bacterium]|nr:sigma-54-dependent Fis family transcriptional regulator [candidate division Zixibacteria bacterium]